jgi:hypothetical protein
VERRFPTYRSALDLALAEAWDDWKASAAMWRGNGRVLLDDAPPGVVCSLWWD